MYTKLTTLLTLCITRKLDKPTCPWTRVMVLSGTPVIRVKPSRPSKLQYFTCLGPPHPIALTHAPLFRPSTNTNCKSNDKYSNIFIHAGLTRGDARLYLMNIRKLANSKKKQPQNSSFGRLRVNTVG